MMNTYLKQCPPVRTLVMQAEDVIKGLNFKAIPSVAGYRIAFES